MSKQGKRGTLAWLLVVAWSVTGQAQVKASRELDHGLGILNSGVTLHYRTMLEPALRNSTSQSLGGGAFGASGDTMRHCLYDRVAKLYFGYDMTVWPGESPTTRKVVFGPVNLAAIREALKAVAGDLPLNPAPVPKYPPPQIVSNGDTIAMDLMTSADGRERIVDYIQFSFGEALVPAKADLAAPQDFTVDDGAVSLDLGQAEVAIDGKKFGGPVVTYPPKGGATLWVYFPGQGRYVLSLAPGHGFAKTGVVRGRRISFTSDGHEYEIRLTQPLAGAEKAWNLYVVRDAGYLPRSTLVNVVVMSADRLENLVDR